MSFTHLHVHSHYSVLDGMSKVPDLIKKCKRDGMYCMALTDHGNMYGIKDLFDSVNKENDDVKDAIKKQQTIIDNSKKEGSTITEEDVATAQQRIESLKQQFFKPIIGIEAYVARRSRLLKDKSVKEINPETGRERIVDSSGYHLILLAKNKQGYKSLCKLSSVAFTEGYYNRPRIDREVLERWHEGVIVCSACLGGELPQLILKGDIAAAEETVKWYKSVFGEDYYIELQRHQTDKPGGNRETFERQQQVNPILIQLARKFDVKLVATNDVHFVEETHGEAHDHLICISTQNKVADPNRMHYTKQEWLKSPEEMLQIFSDIPEALDNTQEIVDKVETYSVDSDPIMPMFPIPASFGSEDEYRTRFTEEDLFNEFTRNEKGEVVMSKEKADAKIVKLGGYDKLYRIKFEFDYLSKLVYEGAHMRYGDTLTDEQNERIVFELHTIKTMGFPGYFLIVQDYIRGAREELGVSVGPGRGSAAGSVVAYCLKITDVDPLQYDLLFERFLNPDRISLPDIDVDFDDAGRGKVLDWITKKYGKEKVAHIITYGTMATKSAIADVGRVEDVPLSVVNTLKSFIPEKFPDNIKNEKGKPLKVNLKNCFKHVPELQSIMVGGNANDANLRQLLTYAEELEDTNRQVGIHACGVIIGADDLTNFAPVCTIYDKESDSDVVVTQYDGHVVESVGLIKMDFLGLKTLTIIKNAIAAIKRNHGVDVDIDHIPIDDQATYDLFCAGNTVGTFQFESSGMQKYLRELHPTTFGDLIAMNALYRPGPMDYIPRFINCRHGREPIVYDIPVMEKYLKETYGVTVYQEQVMLLSRLLANFTRGESDSLRKAMGKKQIEKMNELEIKFLEGGVANGHPKDKLQKIYNDWKKFAEYAFNKSHATCYSWVAYQTAYLKAHYPAEYMAAVLTNSQSDIKRTTDFMEECRRMGLDVLLPSVNESGMDFSVNSKGQIRFGLQAISGMGEAASNAVIQEREKNGPFADIFDFLRRVNIRTINRKNVEVLVKSGAFDDIGQMHRAQYFATSAPNNEVAYLDRLLRWAAREQEKKDSAQMSLFAGNDDVQLEDHPPIPACPAWSNIERCRFEKEVIGFYVSGHPLDDFKYEFRSFTNIAVSELANLDKYVGKELRFAGIVSDVKKGVSQKNGKAYAYFTISDFDGSYDVRMFDDAAAKYESYCSDGFFVFVRASVTQYTYTKPDGTKTTSAARLTFTDFTMLNTVMEKYARKLHFSVNLSDVTPEFCATLRQICTQHSGKTPIELTVMCPYTVSSEASSDTPSTTTLSLSMGNRSLAISPREVLPLLEKMPVVHDLSVG